MKTFQIIVDIVEIALLAWLIAMNIKEGKENKQGGGDE